MGWYESALSFTNYDASSWQQQRCALQMITLRLQAEPQPVPILISLSSIWQNYSQGFTHLSVSDGGELECKHQICNLLESAVQW